MKNIILSGMGSLFLLGCTNNTSPELAQETCPEIEGIENLLSEQSPEIIVIGEVHGSNEPPQFIEALVCQSLKQGYRTALALELSDKEGLYKEYLSSSGDEMALKELFKDHLWTPSRADGRSSEAILNLIESLRLRFSKGEDVAFIPFTGTLDAAPFFDTESKTLLDENTFFDANEKAMADAIISGSETSNAEKTIVLVGSTHARNGKITFGDLNYRAMGDFLDPSNTVRLNAVTSTGTAWNCKQNEKQKLVCSESRVGGQDLKISGVEQLGGYQIFLKDDPSASDLTSNLKIADYYDGLVYVGAATASFPANMEGRKTD